MKEISVIRHEGCNGITLTNKKKDALRVHPLNKTKGKFMD
jgi:hypothetical protein